MRSAIIFGAIALTVVLALLIWWVLPERVQTRVDKSLLEYFGGNCVVEVFSAGQKIREYAVDGYVLFERAEANAGSPAGRHDGVVTFKAKDGSKVRLGAWGGTVLVQCR
jgi:hypothetical protein